MRRLKDTEDGVYQGQHGKQYQQKPAQTIFTYRTISKQIRIDKITKSYSNGMPNFVGEIKLDLDTFLYFFRLTVFFYLFFMGSFL